MADVIETSVLERAARAINPFVWGDGPDRDAYQRDALEKARAVLQAIREPSEAMVNAGCVELNNPIDHPDEMRAAFTAMIDSALAQGIVTATAD